MRSISTEDGDRDDEARPGAEIEEEEAGRGRADRMTRHGAQHERHAPGEPDQNCGAPAGVERPLVEEAQLALEVIERPAARDQEVVASAGRVVGRRCRRCAALREVLVR